MSVAGKKTVVFGSLNMDLVVRAPRLPRPGETLPATSFETVPGGKGANQAVAASRLGVETWMIGRVGDDSYGEALLENMRSAGVDVSGISYETGVSSGIALIAVEESGQNQIMIVPGANARVGATDVSVLSKSVRPGDVVLLQMEVPLAAVRAAAEAAASLGAVVVLDPAPAHDLTRELLGRVDILTPNEAEAEHLTGIRVEGRSSAEAAARRLHAAGARQVLLKMGERGALWSVAGETWALPPFSVRAVDTVAAGDACNGAIAAALCAGLPEREALRWGMAAGALATTRPGAQSAMPGREMVERLLASEE